MRTRNFPIKGALKFALLTCMIAVVAILVLAIFKPNHDQNNLLLTENGEVITTENGNAIRVNQWPEDVPCEAIKQNPDGSFTEVKDMSVAGIHLSGNTFSDTVETHFWNQKCRK